MTQEGKQLLLKDLSARLPYGLKVMVKGFGNDFATGIDFSCEGEEQLTVLYNGYTDDVEKFVPYLRPMSSMTEEEIEELNNLVDKELKDSEPYFVYEQLTVDFYLSHHLDNRLMIEKGLALEAPEDMYK